LASSTPPTLFVGRDHELDDLRETLAATIAGHGSVALLAGEAGIGKTRTAEEFAARAADAGARVVWAKCFEQAGAPAYWPWLQVLRALLVDSNEGMRAALEPVARELSAVVPGESPESRSGAVSEHARFRLFEAVTDGVKQAAQIQPLVLVIDDLHGADVSSLLLLQFMARHLKPSRVFVLGTFRDAGLPATHPVLQTLAETGRIPGNRSIFLPGLDGPAIAELVHASAGMEPSGQLVDAILRETDGNAFLVSEVVRLLVADGTIDRVEGLGRMPVSQRVRAATGRRVATLSSNCQRALAVASVMGREFTTDLLEAVLQPAGSDVGALVDEAVVAGLVAPSPSRVGYWRFDHALTRESLYEDLGPAERSRLHRAVGEGLERLHGTTPSLHLAELAHHFAEASRTSDPGRAIRYAKLAGDHACAASAYEEALRLYASALEAFPRAVAPLVTDRCELMLAIAEAHRGAGQADQATRASIEAADLARASGTREQLARAALSYGTRHLFPGGSTPDPIHVGLLERALAAWRGEDGPLPVRLLGRLAVALFFDDDPTRRCRLSAEAVVMARRLGDPRLLGVALSDRCVATFLSISLDEHRALAQELFQLASETGETEMVFQSHHWRFLDRLASGDGNGATRALHACRLFASRSRDPVHRWTVNIFETTQAMLEGRFADAERLMGETAGLAWCQPATQGVLGIQMFVLRWHQGQLDGIAEMIEAAASLNQATPSFRACIALLHAERARPEPARREYDRLLAQGLADVPRTQLLMTIEFLARVCSVLADVDEAARLYERLLPHDGLSIVIGPGVGFRGCVAHVLGRLAAVRSDWAAAARHLDDALVTYEAMSAAPWLAEAQHDAAAVLLASGGDSMGAQVLNDRALATARELGARSILARAEGLAAAIDARTPQRTADDANLLRREGDYWTVVYDGTTFRLRHSSGLCYLAELLRQPGREIHALELAALRRDEGTCAEEMHAGANRGDGDAGELLDEQARAAYRRRLRELQDELDEAEANHDAGRVGVLRGEREALEDELARAVGLGGRPRRAGSAAERARVNVTRAVRRVVERFDAKHPPLGRHLARRLKTGAFCVYLPDPRLAVRWVIDA
jgi:tetratricopeptide (TPR) repeat protein